MKLFQGEVVEKISRTPAVESVRFVCAEQIKFLPGQFARIIFNETDKEDKILNKYLSFSSSPSKPYVEFTKKITDSKFSQRLRELTAGDKVLFEWPFGNCVFNAQYKKIGFLIGGIGITPVVSIFEYIVENNPDTSVVLFYSNRMAEDIAFQAELDYWQTVGKDIKIFYVLTQGLEENKKYIRGRIDKDLLSGKIKDWRERIFFIFGPPAMVSSMKQICAQLSCEEDKVLTEGFVGY